MTLYNVDLNELVDEVLQSTADPVGPTHLIATFPKMADPFKCADQDERNTLDEAHQTDLGVIYKYSSLGRPLVEEDKAIWINRIAWLVSCMQEAKETPPSTPVLIAMLRTAAAFQRHGSIWSAIPSNYHSNQLRDCMSAIIKGTQCSMSFRGDAVPIWEREAVDAFLKAEAEQNWLVIENSWQTIVSTIWANDDLSEAVKYLNANEPDNPVLAEALDKSNSILCVAAAASAMTPAQIAKVAVNSKSNLTRFALIQALAFESRRNTELEATTLDDLAEVFRSIQSDKSEWAKWMQAFNRYPVRTRILQPAFGASLVNSSEDAKSAYIEAIDLRTSYHDGRDAVSVCLEAFQNKAIRRRGIGRYLVRSYAQRPPLHG